MIISRSDRSNLALWWWTIDRYLLTSFFLLIIFGIFLVMASSQHLAESLNISSHYFTARHIFFGILCVPVIIFFSILNERQTKIICIFGMFTVILMLIFILIEGEKIKGAQRWLYLGNFSFQPSEVCKPFLLYLMLGFYHYGLKKQIFLDGCGLLHQ